jgi:hypothetical protein
LEGGASDERARTTSARGSHGTPSQPRHHALAPRRARSLRRPGCSYVPYQNSKLTMMLMPGLSGRSHTTVVVCASPAAEDAAETVEALRFGELCAVVESHARLPAASLMAETLRALEAEIGTTEAAIVRLERWETFLVEREDERADASGPDGARATERVLTTKLVGAEAERARLEELLLRRRELLGETA